MSLIGSTTDTETFTDNTSLISLPSSPQSTICSNSFNLSNSVASISLSGNGLQSSMESQNSSKSHSPASSVTSTLTVTGNQERSTTPTSTSDGGSDSERAKVNCLK